MGAAYYIALDNDKPGFETFVNGKAIARARDEIYEITEKLGLKGIDDLTSFGEWDEEFEVPEEHREAETPWFEAQEGIRWVSAIRAYITANEGAVPEKEHVLEDLVQYETLLKLADEIGAKWHFAMDI
jgi:hypothetical protein